MPHLTLVIKFSMPFIKAIIYCNAFECRILKTNFGRSITLTPSSLKDFWLASERETTACDQFGLMVRKVKKSKHTQKLVKLLLENNPPLHAPSVNQCDPNTYRPLSDISGFHINVPFFRHDSLFMERAGCSSSV